MYELPTSVSIKGQDFTIRNNGDYRMVIDCFLALEDEELSEQERIATALIIFYQDVNYVSDIYDLPDIEDAVKQMFLFFNCGQEEEKAPHNYKLIDWDKDSTVICAAINNVARTEVRALPNLHWWTFMGYYMSINESFLSTILSIRSKIVKNKKLEKHEREFRAENPQYFVWNSKTVEQKEADNYVMALWNKGNE